MLIWWKTGNNWISNQSSKEGLGMGQTVWWVCAVDPQSFDKILKKGRIFIGMFSCRVTEYLICTRLNEEIEKNMAEGQHGFKKGRSTITAMEEGHRWFPSSLINSCDFRFYSGSCLGFWFRLDRG
ncbi:hypothetical protein QTP88_029950 [Uroleucon formosanum]